MSAKTIYDKLIKSGISSSILDYFDDDILVEIQDNDKLIFKYAKKFFNGYADTEIEHDEGKTLIWCKFVSNYSDDETIRSIIDFYYSAKAKNLIESIKESKKSCKKSLKENKHNFSVYDFIDYVIEMKCIDGIMNYIDFDITQKEFDDALDDLGYIFKIIKKENPHDSIDGIKYYIYQYQINDEIYHIWVDETGFVLDACLKY